MSRARYTIVCTEERGGRTVYLLEHGTSEERFRVYHQRGRWRYFASDEPIRDRRVIAAVTRHTPEREVAA